MTIHHLRITLLGIQPKIWRGVQVPSGITLGGLHQVIQLAMGWYDEHPHQFALKDKSLRKDFAELERLIAEGKWGDMFSASRGVRVFTSRFDPFGGELESFGDGDGDDEYTVTLAEICPIAKGKAKLTYEYDFGDGWLHAIECLKITEPEAGVEYPVCTGGQRACPPEDCGGVGGYEYLLEILADPAHPEYEERLEWLGGEIDPNTFDVGEINKQLAKWRKAQEKQARKSKQRKK